MKTVKKTKEYNHIPSLIERIIQKRVADEQSTHRSISLSAEHPCRITPTIAPSAPPMTSELVAKQHKRTGKRPLSVASGYRVNIPDTGM